MDDTYVPLVDFGTVPTFVLPQRHGNESAVSEALRDCIRGMRVLVHEAGQNGFYTDDTKHGDALLWGEFSHQMLATLAALGGDASKLQELKSAAVLTAAAFNQGVRFTQNFDKQGNDAKLVSVDGTTRRLVEIKSTLCSQRPTDTKANVNFVLPTALAQSPVQPAALAIFKKREPSMLAVVTLVRQNAQLKTYFDDVYARVVVWGRGLFLGEEHRAADLIALHENDVPDDPDADPADMEPVPSVHLDGCVAIVACDPRAATLTTPNSIKMWQLFGPFVAVLLSLHYAMGHTEAINLGSSYCSKCGNCHRLMRLQAASKAFQQVYEHSTGDVSDTARMLAIMATTPVYKNLIRTDQKCDLN